MKGTTMKIATLVAVIAAASAAFGELAVKDGDTLAFLGDSITQQGQGSPDGYVNLVLRSLALEGVYVNPVKAGISGNKSNDMLARLDRDVLSRKPKVMTLSCGVNDVWHHDWNNGVSLEDYKKNISAIFDKCAASNCQVVVLTATMFEKPEMEKFKHNVMVAPYNEWLREEAKRRGYPVADLNADMWKAHARRRAHAPRGQPPDGPRRPARARHGGGPSRLARLGELEARLGALPLRP